MLEGSAERHTFLAQDGERLSYVTWKPAHSPRAGLLLHPGYGEHGAHMEPVALHLVQQGYFVAAIDARGHGCSAGQRGHIDRFECYLEDVGALHQRLHREQPELPGFFVLGHSLGGLIALHYAASSELPLLGLVVTNPLLGLRVKVPPYKKVMAQLLSSLWPTFSLWNELLPEHMSRDPQEVMRYRDDPLMTKKASARWLMETTRVTAESERVLPPRLQLPVLFMLSTADQVVDFHRGERLYQALTTSDKTLHMFEGGFHEIFADLNRQEAYRLLSLWLEQELAAQCNKS
ncbi:MAG: lysophospholipase [Myxococcota bacterium]